MSTVDVMICVNNPRNGNFCGRLAAQFDALCWADGGVHGGGSMTVTNPSTLSRVRTNPRYSPTRPEAVKHLAECAAMANYHDSLFVPISMAPDTTPPKPSKPRTIFPIEPKPRVCPVIVDGTGFPALTAAARATGIPYLRLSRAWRYGWKTVKFGGREWSIERISA